MTHSVKSRLLVFFLFLLLLVAALPAAADVTVSGTVNFSSLDGSAQDDDHTVNGVFTVNSNLTVQGIINCNDTGAGSSSACSMAFAAAAISRWPPAARLRGEPQQEAGTAATSLSPPAARHVARPCGNLLGALISSSRLRRRRADDHAGNITISAGGVTSLQPGIVTSPGRATVRPARSP